MATAAPEHRPTAVTHLTVAERVARGKAARAEVPRSSHAAFDVAPGRPDPVDLLERQAQTRVPDLVPIRYGRMLVSPFTFYRGAALIMADDLATTPRSGLTVQCCGDAHLSNFGAFASPERQLVFDLNDFDETHPGPWEWDVKRLAVSMLIAARDNGFSRKEQDQVVLTTVREYRTSMRAFAVMHNLDVWYAHLDADTAINEVTARIKPTKAVAKQLALAEKNIAKARTRDSMFAFSKLTEVVDGEVRIVDESPLIVPITKLTGDLSPDEVFEGLRELLRQYRHSLELDRRALLEEFQLRDLARKVVGVGSVGTRAWIALLMGRDSEDPLFLQIKEAEGRCLRGSSVTASSPTTASGSWSAASDASRERHLPWLAPSAVRARRQRPRLLRTPVEGLEGLGGRGADDSAGDECLRTAVRVDPRPGACAERRPDRNRIVSRRR